MVTAEHSSSRSVLHLIFTYVALGLSFTCFSRPIAAAPTIAASPGTVRPNPNQAIPGVKSGNLRDDQVIEVEKVAPPSTGVETFKDITAGTQSCFSVLAVLIGAVWTVLLVWRNRQTFPCKHSPPNITLRSGVREVPSARQHHCLQYE